MTTFVPGFDQQLSPAIQGFTGLAMHLMHPDKKYVDALRQSLQEGRISPQELNNMTPEEISAKYNIKLDNAKQFTTGQQDSKTIVDKFTGDQLKNILKAGPGNPQFDELVAHYTNTQTPTQRKVSEAQGTIAGNQAVLSDAEKQSIQADLQSTDPKVVEAAKARLSGRATKDVLTTQGNEAKITGDQATVSGVNTEDMVKSRVVTSQLLKDINGEKNLYSAYRAGKITPEQQAAIQNDKDLKGVFEGQRDDFWKQQEMDFRNKSLGDRPENIFLRKAAEMATKYGEYSGMSNPKDIYTVMQSPTLQGRYTDMKKEDVQPAEQPMWEAAQAIKIAKDRIAKVGTRQNMNDKLSVERAFQSGFGSDIRMLSDPTLYQRAGINEKNAQPLVAKINAAAAAYYSDLVVSGVMDEKDVPQYAFDSKGEASNRMFKDQALLHQVSGVGSDITKNDTPKTDPVIEAAKKAFDAGTFTEADLDKANIPAEDKKAIKDYIASKKPTGVKK